jgi:anti-sigma factor RsiW
MKDTHLKDDVLVALCLDEAPIESSDHLAACPACGRRLASLAAMLDGIADTMTATADAAFPPERRARQQMRILQRVAQHATFGRVLAFPHAHQPASRRPLRPTRMRRWVAGAAAAGLFIGMLAGHLVHQLPVLQPAAQTQTAPVRQPAAALRAATTLSDDEFLREVQRVLDRSGPVALGRLDALTPVAWEMP